MNLLSDFDITRRRLKLRWRIVNYFVTGYEVSYSIPPRPYLPGITEKSDLKYQYGIVWTFARTTEQARENARKLTPAYANILHSTEYPGLVRRLSRCVLHFLRYGVLNR